ncbi:MAG TPA: F0F1 ATP synthase subunit B, partial [Acidimicrobiales bacterium]
TQDCKKLLDEGKTLDACQQAPSPILPPMNELVWGIISFVAVMALLWKLAWPGIKTGMEGRTQKIAKDLEEAEAQRTGAEGILAEYKAQLADAKTESARIIDEARQSADAMRKDLEARAAADIAELRTRAASDIEAAKVQAIADLRAEVTELAIGAAESVVGHSLDQATSTALVEQYIDQVGASR